MINPLWFLLFVLGFTFGSCHSQNELPSHKEILKLMGTRFEISATADDVKTARKAVEAGIVEIQRIEDLISSWKADSQTSDINRNAGIAPVKVDSELFKLVQRAQKISELTEGAFDISFASMDRIYQFDKSEHVLPSKAERAEAVRKINFKNIQLDETNSTVFLKEEGMRIGFGGIGKGYAANQAKVIMKSIKGVKGGVVNASGDLVVWGENGHEEGWPIQISDPKDINKSLGGLTIKNASVVTSGDYEKFFTSDGQRYAHIINPHSGLPTTGIKSATIVSPDAELGDALATSIFVLGAEAGMNLINRLKNVEALIITDDNKIQTSNNLQINKY